MPILIMDRHWDVVLNGFPDASNHGTHATLKLYFRSAFTDKNRWNKLTAPSQPIVPLLYCTSKPCSYIDYMLGIC